MIQYFPIVTGSLVVLGNVSVSGSINASGSVTISGSIASASYALSASNAATASSADNFLTRGTLTAQTIVVQTITSSVDFVTGSTQFGSKNTDIHTYTGSLAISGSSTVGLNVNNGALFVTSSGFVGIGTTNPTVKLDVGYDSNNRSIVRLSSNAANRMAAIRFDGNNAESGYIGYEGGSEIVSGGQQGDLVIRNMLSGKDIILDTNAGNVGIGTTNPGAKLEIAGAIIINPAVSAGTSTYLQFNNSGSVIGYVGSAAAINGGAASSITLGVASGAGLTISSTGAATFSSSVAASYLSVTGAIPSSVASTGYIDYSSGGIRIFAVGTGGSTKGTFSFYAKGADDSAIIPFSIANTGAATFSSSVTASGNFLSSYSSNTTTGNAFPRIGASNTNATQQDFNISELYVSAGNGTVYGGIVASYSSTFPTSTPSVMLRNSGDGPLYFSTNGSIKQTITSGGNVGIGTTSPAQLLHLYGTGATTLKIEGASVNSAYGRLILSGRPSAGGHSVGYIPVTSTNGGQAETTVAYIDIPSEDGTNKTYFSFATHNGTSLGERMRITSGGNVLIGTTDNTAAYRLNVSVNGGSSYIGVTNQAGGTGDRYLRIGFGTGASVASIQGTRVNVADDVNIVLNPDGGNVGIGTNPTVKLDVNGAARFNGTIANVGTGTGTYTQTTWYVDTSNQILFENGRQTDSASGTGRTVYFTWRGGPGVGGGVQLIHGANAWAAYTSDARMKTKVADVPNGLEAIMKLEPIKFKWTRELENSRTVTGFTAQNVQQAIPDAVFNSWQDEELGDVLSYYQDYLTPYLVKAIQEQQAQIEELKSKLT